MRRDRIRTGQTIGDEDWLQKRQRRAAELIQDAFPEMKAEDREFLMTGITPAEWDRMFNRPGWRAARRKIINR